MNEIISDYESGMSSKELGKKYGYSPTTILKHLRLKGVTLRTKSEVSKIRGETYSQWCKDHPEEVKLRGEQHSQWYKDHPEEVKLKGEKVSQYYEDHPKELKLRGEKIADWFENHPEEVKLRGETYSQWCEEHPEERKLQNEQLSQWCEDHPEEVKSRGEKTSQYWEDHPEEAELRGDKLIQYWIDHPEQLKIKGERSSAIQQGQDFDAGEWTGFVPEHRLHVLPINQCTRLNERFEGSEGHHTTNSIVIFIPAELHRHIGHNTKNGKNMAEINMIALQYINGCYDG